MGNSGYSRPLAMFVLTLVGFGVVLLFWGSDHRDLSNQIAWLKTQNAELQMKNKTLGEMIENSK